MNTTKERAVAALVEAFDSWWHNEGSGMPPLPDEDAEIHTLRVSRAAWFKGYEEGMTEAAKISAAGGCTNAGCLQEYHGKRCPCGIEDLILAARNEKAL